MDALERMLGTLARMGEAQAKDLARELGVSQPTDLRLIGAAGDRVCRMGQTRATRYARTRTLPGLGTRLPLYRVNEAGRVEPFGALHLLKEGTTLAQHLGWNWSTVGGPPAIRLRHEPAGVHRDRHSARATPSWTCPPDWGIGPMTTGSSRWHAVARIAWAISSSVRSP